MFDVGQGTQDLGFRNEVNILFNCEPAVEVTLDILDDDGKPTTAHFVIRDTQGRVYPSHVAAAGARLLLSRADLSPQRRERDAAAGQVPRRLRPRAGVSRARQATSPCPTRCRTSETFQLERWIKMADYGWFSGDHHIHAAGCAHYEAPAEGVQPVDMMRHILGEDLNVGCVLSWGPCWYFQKQYFEGKVHKLSQPGEPDALRRRSLRLSQLSTPGTCACCGSRKTTIPARRASRSGPVGTCRFSQWGKTAGGRRRLFAQRLGAAGAGQVAAHLRHAQVRRHRGQRVHRRRRARRLRLHLGGRHAGHLGAEHLVSHAQLRLHVPHQRRDRLPLHLRRQGRPGPGLRQARPRTSRSTTTAGSSDCATAAATAATG